MRSLVYLKTSDIAAARPDHECSASLAQKIIAARFARPIGRNTIQLIVEESWQWVKAAARSMMAGTQPKSTRAIEYQHHIEPRLQKLTLSNSAWMQYVNGYRFSETV